MRRIAWWGLAATLMAFAAFAQESRPKYEAFEGPNPEARGSMPVFQFSSARATSDDPVMVSIRGRKLTAPDRREHRTAVQRYWLAVNVPEQWEGVERYQSTCFHERPNEFPSCDVYVYVDPKTKQEHAFYLYIGNWPFDEADD